MAHILMNSLTTGYECMALFGEKRLIGCVYILHIFRPDELVPWWAIATRQKGLGWDSDKNLKAIVKENGHIRNPATQGNLK